MKEQKVKIGNLITTAKGKKPKVLFDSPLDNSKRFIKIEDLRSNSAIQYTSDGSGVEVNEDDLCIVWDGANAGTVGYGLEGYIGSTIARLRPKDHDHFFTPYLGRFLQSKFKELRHNTAGATIPHIRKDYLSNMSLSLPPLPEQMRIAAILDKADAIRRKRLAAIKLADDFLRAVFLDMFGDPVTNPKGWETKKLAELVDPERKITYGILKPGENTPDGVPMLRIQDITDGEIDQNELHYVTKKLSNQYRRTILRGGEIVISLVGTIGLVARVPSTLNGANLHRNLGLIVPGKEVNPVYLHQLMVLPNFLTLLDRVTKGGIQRLLNLGDLATIPIPLPTIELQGKFENIVNYHIVRIRKKIFGSSITASKLFNSLTQRAFRGEL
jgi:type I restriction enzyme, S subunit